MDSCFLCPSYTASASAFKFSDLSLLEGLLVVIRGNGFSDLVINCYPSFAVLVQVGWVFSCNHDVREPVMDLRERLMSISCLAAAA